MLFLAPSLGPVPGHHAEHRGHLGTKQHRCSQLKIEVGVDTSSDKRGCRPERGIVDKAHEDGGWSSPGKLS